MSAVTAAVAGLGVGDLGGLPERAVAGGQADLAEAVVAVVVGDGERALRSEQQPSSVSRWASLAGKVGGAAAGTARGAGSVTATAVPVDLGEAEGLLDRAGHLDCVTDRRDGRSGHRAGDEDAVGGAGVGSVPVRRLEVEAGEPARRVRRGHDAGVVTVWPATGLAAPEPWISAMVSSAAGAGGSSDRRRPRCSAGRARRR